MMNCFQDAPSKWYIKTEAWFTFKNWRELKLQSDQKFVCALSDNIAQQFMTILKDGSLSGQRDQ